jgi:hypothetical protein
VQFFPQPDKSERAAAAEPVLDHIFGFGSILLPSYVCDAEIANPIDGSKERVSILFL